MKGVILSLFFACCAGDAKGRMERTCCEEQLPHGRGSLFDSAMENHLTSQYLRNMTLPGFNLTKKVGFMSWHIQFHSITTRGLKAVKREGRNYIEAKQNESMRIRMGFRVEELNLSIAFRAKNPILFMGYTNGKIEAFASSLTFILEVKEIGGELNVTHCNLKIDGLHVRFISQGRISRILNNMGTFQAYFRNKLNHSLHDKTCSSVNKHVHVLGTRDTEKQSECSNCRKMEVILRRTVLKYGLDPVPLSPTVSDLFGSIAQAKVTNGTVRGLSRLRRSGDFIASIGDCGANFFADVTVNNLTVTLNVTVTAFFTIRAIVSINISARVIFSIVEWNRTLVLETLSVNMTEPVHVDVTPIGSFSYLFTSLLPEPFIAAAVTTNVHQLLNNTIQKGIDKLQKFAE
ncbi:hypothetical protein MTO96_052222 [Rhipicephalus appendiculatus]